MCHLPETYNVLVSNAAALVFLLSLLQTNYSSLGSVAALNMWLYVCNRNTTTYMAYMIYITVITMLAVLYINPFLSTLIIIYLQ